MIGSNHVPPPRGRIAPPNAAMINLAKSRDPRLARQQAQLAAQMVAASTNSTPTMVGGTQIPPHNPIVLDQSGKPVSIRERLGRIPKRTDPRIKSSGTDVDRRKPSSTATSSSVNNSSSPSHKSRSENDASKKREKKDELSPKSARSSSSKPSSSDKKKLSADALSPKSSSPLKKKTSSLSEKSPSRSEKTSPKSREGKVSKGNKSSTRRPGDIAKNSEDSSVSPSSSSENLMPVANESKDVDLRLLIPEKKLKLEQQQPPQHPQAKLVSKPLPDQSKSEINLLPQLSTISSSVQKQCITVMLSLAIIQFRAMIGLAIAAGGNGFVLPLLLLSTMTAFQRNPRQFHLLSEKIKPSGRYCINGHHCLYDNRSMTTLDARQQQRKTRALNYLICCQINAVFDERNRNHEGIWIKM